MAVIDFVFQLNDNAQKYDNKRITLLKIVNEFNYAFIVQTGNKKKQSKLKNLKFPKTNSFLSRDGFKPVIGPIKGIYIQLGFINIYLS